MLMLRSGFSGVQLTNRGVCVCVCVSVCVSVFVRVVSS